MRTNTEYKNASLDRLRGNWKPVVLASLVVSLISLVVVGAIQGPSFIVSNTVPPNLGLLFGLFGGSMVLYIFVLYPLMLGYTNSMRLVYERRDYEATHNMFAIAKSNYLHKVAGMFLYYLKIVLWTMLFVIPGIIMTFAYAMTPYILEEHPEISAWEASTRSREMMKGHKFDLFYLYLSFIGWFFLAMLTAGIGTLWLAPYVEGAKAAFYNDLKAEQGEEAVTE